METRPRGRRDAEPPHQWLGAVVAAPYGYPFLVQELREVVRMHVRQGEGDQARPVLFGTVDLDALYLREPPVSVLPELSLVFPDVLHAQIVEVVHGGAQA